MSHANQKVSVGFINRFLVKNCSCRY